MIEEILPKLYRIEVPLPQNPLKYLNSYLIKGSDRFLIIDTGMNREECMREMISSLKTMNVDLSRTDFFVTHMHADHLGLVPDLATDSSKVHFNFIEASIIEWLFCEVRWQKVAKLFRSNGFPEDELQKALVSNHARRYAPKHFPEFHMVRDGDTIEIEDYLFRCIETPGHSPGHMCLYEADKKILVCGDHILFDITPNIPYYFELEGSLRSYLASLEKVCAVEATLVLPGHRRVGNNHRKRINELQTHHRNRLNEVISALDNGEKTAFEVAPHISWDVRYGSWTNFPVAQKYFAVSETIAHLKYLEEDKVIQRHKRGQQVVFSLL